MSSQLLTVSSQSGKILQHPAASKCIAQKTWNGILHIAYIKSPPIETLELSPLNHHVTLMLGNGVDTEWWREGKRDSKRILPHQITVDPCGIACKGRIYNPSEALVIELEYQFVKRVIDESVDINQIEFIPKTGQKDLLLRQIALSLMSEISTEHSGTQLYGEAAAAMLVAHLLRYYSVEKPALDLYQGGLPRHKLQRIRDYIQENLNQKICLEELAQFAQISTYHFCHLFKQSVGNSPRQYILQRRIEKARQLLKKTDLRINEIALEVGYQSSSHFSAIFKRHTGVTPGKYRQLI